jgi:hypothetical protein
VSPTRREFLKSTGALALMGGLRRVGAQPRKPLRDVVVLLPGIMGSVLEKDGREVWALSGSAIVNGIRSLGGSIGGLTLTGDSDTRDDLGDGITATRLLPDTHLIPGLWKIDGYSRISTFITEQFDAQKGQNFFEFPYDWRRDNRIAARKLKRDSERWLAAWRQRSGNADAKLILVAHSMGGLVSRYFLEALEGWKQTRMLITFGTPYRGSVNALDFLANGIKKKIGPFTVLDISSLVRSFTSVYQLLPTYRCFDSGGGTLTRIGETTGIPNVDARRAREALAFHNDIVAAVERNARDASYLRTRYTVHPIIGSYQPTLQSAKLAGGVVQTFLTLGPDASLKGDGTVPQGSARPIETPELEKLHRMVYVAEVHGSLQNSPAMLDHVGGLLQEGAVAWDKFRAADVADVSVSVDDLYGTTERVVVRAQCDDLAAPLNATVVEAGSGAEVARVALPGGGGLSREAALGPLPEGTYRITVRGGPQVGSATDVFIVIGA